MAEFNNTLKLVL